MTEGTEYAVLRFVEQNGGCHRINDLVKGRSIMDYVKEEIPITRQCMFRWMIRLAGQLEQCQRCAEREAYGYVNPWAIIITEASEVRLLDTEDLKSRDLVKKMQTKKVRMLFVRREYMLSQHMSAADDLYSFGKLLQFAEDTCRIQGEFTGREKRILKRTAEECMKERRTGWKPERGEWRRIQRQLRGLLEEGKQPGNREWKKWILAGVISLVMIVSGIGWMEKRSRRKEEGLSRTAESEKVSDEKSGEESGKEPGGEADGEAGRAYLELGLVYFAELEEYEESRRYLEMASRSSRLAEDYLTIVRYLQRSRIQNSEKRDLWKSLKRGREELDKLQKEKEVEENPFVYKLPFLYAWERMDTEEGWREMLTVGREILDEGKRTDSEEDESREKEVRKCLAKAYEMLDEPDGAAEEYEWLKERETNDSELEEIYLKLERLYDEGEEAEKAWDICRESVEKLPQSVKLWTNCIRRYCQNESIGREVCAELIRKGLAAQPELMEDEAFREMQGKFGITIEGEAICVGE